jgi:hypothetical protein
VATRKSLRLHANLPTTKDSIAFGEATGLMDMISVLQSRIWEIFPEDVLTARRHERGSIVSDGIHAWQSPGLLALPSAPGTLPFVRRAWAIALGCGCFCVCFSYPTSPPHNNSMRDNWTLTEYSMFLPFHFYTHTYSLLNLPIPFIASEPIRSCEISEANLQSPFPVSHTPAYRECR